MNDYAKYKKIEENKSTEPTVDQIENICYQIDQKFKKLKECISNLPDDNKYKPKMMELMDTALFDIYTKDNLLLIARNYGLDPLKNIYNKLSDTVNQIENKNENYDNSYDSIQRKVNKFESIKDNLPELDTTLKSKIGAIVSIALLSFSILQTVNCFSKQGHGKSYNTVDNKFTNNIDFNGYYDSTLVVYDDVENGMRKKSVYYIDSDDVLSEDAIQNIDLSKLELINESYGYYNNANQISNDHFIEYNYIKDNYGLQFLFIFTDIISLLTFCVFEYYSLEDEGDELLIPFIYKNIYSQIVELYLIVENRIQDAKLKNLIKKLYEEINSIMDIYISDLSMKRELTNDESKIASILNEKKNIEDISIRDKEKSHDEFSAILDELIKHCIEKEKQNDRYVYGKITVPFEYIIDEVGPNHFKFKDKYKDVLRFFDLHLILLDGLEVTNINFENSNIVINPQWVWKKNISYSKFGPNNLIDFADFLGVTMYGTEINVDESTLINITDASVKMDENTTNNGIPLKNSIRKLR